MKKILVLLAVVLLSVSCEKEEPKVIPTTYTVTFDVEVSDITSIDVTIFEYNDAGEKIGSNSMSVNGITTKQFEASNLAAKVKVYFKATIRDYSDYFWIQQVYYLSKEKDTKIDISGSTMTGKKEP